MELSSTAAQLARSLERAGLAVAASHLIEIATRPHTDKMQSTTPVRRTRRSLRHWLDSEPGPWIQESIAELIVAALVEPQPAITERTDIPESNISNGARPIVEVKRRLAGSRSE